MAEHGSDNSLYPRPEPKRDPLMLDAVVASLAEEKQRNAVNQARIELLKEIVAFHKSLRPDNCDDLEATTVALASGYLEMGLWLTEALSEALVEAKRGLGEVQQMNAVVRSKLQLP